ncbi:MAG TPA: hypothetical protein VFS11_04590 [Gemmatimonadales bacterium]|nr:hypothetical protein [Gemmatimonadales bacterium]
MIQTEPPANGEYLVAAYIVAAVIVLGYASSLWRRARRVLHRGGEGKDVAR